MSDRFVVEANRSIVGIAVRVAGGFRFFASDPDYHELEGKTFRRARAVTHGAAKLARLRSRIAPVHAAAGGS